MKTCPVCGEDKPRKAFWGEHRQPMEVCTQCRRKAKRHEKYLKEKQYKQEAAARAELAQALRKQHKLLTDTVLAGAYNELLKMERRIQMKVRQHEDKIARGEGTVRTEQAVEFQSRKLAYYADVRAAMMADAAEGKELPLEHYLTNTFLLHKHGFPVAVVDDPPADRTPDNPDEENEHE